VNIAGFSVSGDVVVLGAITGMVYGISAIGLVLVYRASRIVNFAHGQIGTLAAALLGVAVLRWHVPYWVAFAICLVAGAAVGAISEAVLARRLRDAPLVVSVIATLGLSQLLYLAATLVNSGASAGSLFPRPNLIPSFRVGALLVTPAYASMLFITPLIVVALTVFLRKGRLGVAVRAASTNPDAARMAGIGTERMAGLAWALAGAVAAFTAILVLPTRPYTGADFLGPGLLLRALVCAVVARMTSLPIAFASAIVLGVTESLLLANYSSGGVVEAALFVLIAVTLLVQRRRSGRLEERAPWISVVPWPAIPEPYLRVFAIRNMGRLGALALVSIALIADAFVSNSNALVLSIIAAFALVGLSVGIVTGLSGQLSLGQFAIAGVGAATYTIVNTHGLPLIVAVVAGCLASAFASLVLALPALRIRGLMLAITTLSFALAAQEWLFQQPWMLGDGRQPKAPALGPWHFDTGRSYFLFASKQRIPRRCQHQRCRDCGGRWSGRPHRADPGHPLHHRTPAVRAIGQRRSSRNSAGLVAAHPSVPRGRGAVAAQASRPAA
jgi:branched-subunit amino acid ABC-type transport system permease component